MLSIRYDSNGSIKNGPVSLSPGDDLSFELISELIEIVDTDTCELTLALESPVAISAGELKFTWGGDSTSFIPAGECTAYSIGLALNALDSIIAVGGVDVSATGKAGNFAISFKSVGTRTNFTITHSILGALSGRSIVVLAGSVSLSAHFEFDLSVQVLSQSLVPTDIDPAAFVVANITTGDATNAQRNSVTLSRAPEYGKFQIWTASDTATRWLTTDSSSYEVECALEDIAPGAFLVSRDTKGEEVTWDLRRLAVGVNAAPIVKSTILGPVGVSMSLDLEKVSQLLLVSGVTAPASARLTFRHESATQFSQPVDISPLLRPQVKPL